MNRCVVRGARPLQGDDDGGEGREFLLRRVARHDGQQGGIVGGTILLDAHSGMFPCFLAGLAARLSRSARSPRTICSRVSDGAMTAST